MPTWKGRTAPGPASTVKPLGTVGRLRPSGVGWIRYRKIDPRPKRWAGKHQLALALGSVLFGAVGWYGLIPVGQWAYTSLITAIVVQSDTPAPVARGMLPWERDFQAMQPYVIRLGFILGLFGLIGYIVALFDTPFSDVLACSLSFFIRVGMLGSGLTLLSLLLGGL